MFCKHCGKKVSEESKFCRHCGNDLSSAVAEAISIETPINTKGTFSTSLVAVLTGVITILVTFLVLLNFLSGIVGGIWLAFSGGLSLVIFGIVLSFIMPFGYAILILPQMGALGIFIKLQEKGYRSIGTLIGFLASFYGNLVLVVWTIFVFDSFVASQQFNIIALLLWGYSTVMAPLSYMASKEASDSIGTSLGLLLAQLCFIALTILFLFNIDESFKYPVLISISFLFSFLSAAVIYSSMNSER